MAELFNNLCQSVLALGITDTDVNLTVASGDGNALFPVLGGSDFFRCLLFNKTTAEVEIIRVTARNGDVLDITRAQEGIGNIPAAAFAFNAGDLIELRPTSGFLASLGAVSAANIQLDSFNYGLDSGVANSYDIAISPVPAAYVRPGRYMFQPANSSTGPSDLSIAGVPGGPKLLVRESGQSIQAGDIVANGIAMVLYDGAQFILLNPASQILPGNWSVGGNLKIGKSAYFSALFDNGIVNASAKQIDWNESNKQKIVLSPTIGNIISLTFINPLGPTDMKLTVYQDGTGSRTLTYPAGTKFTGGSAPVLSTAPGAEDILVIYYDKEAGPGAYHVGLAKGWSA